MFSDEYYFEVKNKWKERLFKISGVQAIGIGPKCVNGRGTGKLAILVYVEQKQPLSSLEKRNRIPAYVSGIPTDVKLWSASVDALAQITVNSCPKGNIEAVTEITDAANKLIGMKMKSTAHNLFDGELITISAPAGVQAVRRAYKVTLIDNDNFSIDVIEHGNILEPVITPYTANTASWLTVSTYDTLCCCPSGDIQTLGVTTTVEITSANHGLNTDDIVKIKKSGRKLQPDFYKIKKIDDNNFTLVGAKPADFGGIPTGWKWFKVSLALIGNVKSYDKTSPIVIHCDNHGLADGNKIVINNLDGDAKLNNHLDTGKEPYLVKKIDNNKFSLQEFIVINGEKKWADLNATSFSTPPAGKDYIAIWIRVTEDLHKYSRLRGGIRVEMVQSSKSFKVVSDGHGGTVLQEITGSMIDTSNTTSGTKVTPGGERIHTETIKNVGTLGCIAIDQSVTPNKKVMLSNAHVIAAVPKNPEVHHPTYYDSSTDCSSHRKGNMIRFSIPNKTTGTGVRTVDAAIASIKKDVASDQVVVDIGPLQGGRRPKLTPTDIANHDFKVWKRGSMTAITEGIVMDVGFTQKTNDDGFQWNDQLLVEPISGFGRGIMCVLGDSGSVLVDKENMVIGLLHKGTREGQCIASHIMDVEDELKIRIWKENEVVADLDAGDAENEPLAIGPGIPNLLTDSVAELTAAGGASFVAMVQSHYYEVFNLVKKNRQFAFVWFHNHGPELIHQLRTAVERRTRLIPDTIRKKPLQKLASNIFEAMKKYGSAKLVNTINTYESWLLQIIGMTYEEILEHFKAQQHLNLKKVCSE